MKEQEGNGHECGGGRGGDVEEVLPMMLLVEVIEVLLVDREREDDVVDETEKEERDEEEMCEEEADREEEGDRGEWGEE